MSSKCKICGTSLWLNSSDSTGECSRCHKCKAIFCLAHEWNNLPEAVNPGGLEIESSDNKFMLTIKWFRPQIIFILLFNILWLFVIPVISGFAIMERSIEIALFALACFLTAAYLINASLAYCLNETVIKIEDDKLSTKHGPIPLYRNRELNLENIEGLYIKEKEHAGDDNEKPTYSYLIMLIDKNGKHIKLVNSVSEREQTIYIAQELERRLGFC